MPFFRRRIRVALHPLLPSPPPSSVIHASGGVPPRSPARTLINKFGKQAFVLRQRGKTPPGPFTRCTTSRAVSGSHSFSAVTFYFASSFLLSFPASLIPAVIGIESVTFTRHKFICPSVSISCKLSLRWNVSLAHTVKKIMFILTFRLVACYFLTN